ncbi:protein priB [Lentinula detonsa]|uniref:Protein priB n=1 Tax=Lentinula detonsa TaxID=2804962 RepID=A0AA38QB62_9AGAR|nr:protein priB [Lentinula detonsa]
MEVHAEQLPKPPVVRGARACTTCRAAKMKCVGAEDGQRQCQRCKRANVQCVFEKHRRGRKPGSKLSEASKMLRRLEKGLNNAKSKALSIDAKHPSSYQDSHPSLGGSDNRYTNGVRSHPYSPPNGRFVSNHLPPLNLPSYSDAASEYTASSTSSRTMDVNDDEDDSASDRTEDNIFPANFIQRERRRNSFFRLILNPEDTPASRPSSVRGSESYSPPPAGPAGLSDPVSAGTVDEELAKVLFDLIFLRLNPFINLFDPSLHTVSYVRNKSPFLFTVLIMAGCKFFRPKLFKQCQKLADEYAVQAFREGSKSVEIVQAFACLTYWKDHDDNRTNTWTFVGYACRMAVEIGLNRYIPHPPLNETDLQRLERRNRERTYLVLFIHDRSLSTQTGRHWMLPEDDFIRNADRWHEKSAGGSIRPEDVVVAAFAETTEIFQGSVDMSWEVVLCNCNSQLTQWNETWHREMQQAGGGTFHFSFLTLFRTYIRLFTNSLALRESSNRATPNVQALSACYTSAVDSLKVVSDFAKMNVLRYGQETITMMSAYAALFLLSLLRNSNTLLQLHSGAADNAYKVILETADAYHEASPASSSAAYHARFLKGLLANDMLRYRNTEKSAGTVRSSDSRSQRK